MTDNTTTDTEAVDDLAALQLAFHFLDNDTDGEDTEDEVLP
ncbi:hypothetical protein [Gordonia jacobaea]|nr:hypothetical protein [Gordonia jacobaea]